MINQQIDKNETIWWWLLINVDVDKKKNVQSQKKRECWRVNSDAKKCKQDFHSYHLKIDRENYQIQTTDRRLDWQTINPVRKKTWRKKV